MTTSKPRQGSLIGGLFSFAAVNDWGWFAAFAPLLTLHFRQLWAFQHYQFFPLILLCLPLLFRRLLSSGRTAEHDRFTTVTWLTAQRVRTVAWVLLLLATVGWSPNLAAVATLFGVGSLLLKWRRDGRIAEGVPIWLVLWTLVRLPLDLDIDLIFWLQGITSEFASKILDSVGINHVLHGHVIRIPSDGFLVEEACSGIQSLFTLVAFTLVALCVVRRSRMHCFALVVAAVIWAALVNTLRVSIVVMAAVWFELDIASGTPHELLGMVLFVIAVTMLVSTDSLLLAAFPASAPKLAHLAPDSAAGVSNPPATTENTNATRPGLVAFAILGLLQIVIIGLQQRSGDAINPDDPRIALALVEDALPEQVGNWKRIHYFQTARSAVSYMGRNSVSWTYQHDKAVAVISVDYPFLGWHELENCYRAQGCIVSDRLLLPTEPGLQTVECNVKDPGGAVGRLWYSQFTNSGDPLTPLGNGANTAQYWLSRLQSSFLRQAAAFRSNPGNYQVQMRAYHDVPPSQQQGNSCLSLHRMTTKTLVSLIREATE